MVGIPTLFMVRDLVVERLNDSEQSVLQEVFEVIASEPEYSYFGALGVNLFDFIPSTPVGDNGGNNGRFDAYAAIWREVFTILNDENEPDNPDRNILAVLQRIRSLINDLSEVSQTQDTFQLVGLRDRIERVEEDREIIKAFIGRIENADLFNTIYNLINVGMRPVGAVDIGQTILPPEQWTLREHVSAFKTGDFANRLVARAKESGDSRFLAYAYGFKTAYVTNVVGNPFINSISGSVSRLRWWRGRWIERFVDAWVWGFYDPNRVEPEPEEPVDFKTWRGLCNAELHRRLALGGLSGANPIEVMQSVTLGRPLPEAVPSDFRTFWLGTFEEIYGSNGNLGLVTGVRLNDALVWSWLTLWFTTSASSLGCNPQPSITVPIDIFDPNSANPFADNNDADDGDGEDSPLDGLEPEFEPDRLRTACGIILAILGFIGVILGDFAAGISIVVAGVQESIEGAVGINQNFWQQLRQNLSIAQWYLYNSIDGLNRMLLVAGLGHPYPFELDDPTTRLNLPDLLPQGGAISFTAGSTLYTSQRTRNFPARLWNPENPIESWIFQPLSDTSNTELPSVIGYEQNEELPSFFIDDPSDPDVAGFVLDHKEFPPPSSWPDLAIRRYVNAVDNAIDAILRESEEELPNLNLQGDRGIGFGTWAFSDTTYNLPITIEPAP